MGWVKLDDGFFRHPKALAAGADARFLALASICWAGAYMTDGRIPSYALPALAFDAGLSIDEAQVAADRLVEVRLWVREPDGWSIHGWDDWQSLRDEREKKAQLSRERQRRYRERRAGQPVGSDVTRESRVTDALVTRPESESESESESEAEKTSTKGSLYESSSSSSGGSGGTTDDDDRVRAVTDEIAQRKFDARVRAGKVKDDPSGYLRSCKANTLVELADAVAAALAAGRTAEQIADDHAPKPTTSRAAAARSRQRGTTTT